MKIPKYLDFINESLDLILESDVVYSDNLRKALIKIDNPISKKLIELENKDLPIQSNYFDILLDKNDTISFIPDRRAQDILKNNTKEIVKYNGEGGWLTHNINQNGSIFDMLGYTIEEGETPHNPSFEEIGEVIRKVTSPTSGTTYAWVKFKNGQGVYNINRLSPADDKMDQIWNKNRQEIRVGRGVRSLLNSSKSKFTDKEIEEFVNQYKAVIDKLNDKFSNFEVVKGDSIAYWYKYTNYLHEQSHKGTLGSSCMSDVDDDYFDMYCQNPDKISLVIYKSPENDLKILGRALLWKLDDDKMFMDRIYVYNDSDVELFRQYAKENKWYCKYYNNSTANPSAISPDGDVVKLNLTILIKRGGYDNYPYLDTFKYYNKGSGKISTIKNSGDYTLEDTEGHFLSCDYCNGSGERECYDCEGSGRSDCNRCDGDGEITCDVCDGDCKVDCPECDGNGTIENGGDKPKKCPICSGECEVTCPECDGNGNKECPDCDGRGYDTCETCGGDGNIDCDEC